MDLAHIIESAMGGIITGVFSAGAVWGVLKTEMRWLRRDLDEVRKRVFNLSGPADLK